MILVLIVGGVMGWKARRVSLQKRAIAALERLGGSVIYDWDYDDNDFVRKPGASPAGPIWLRKFLGDEYFQEVILVRLPGESIPPRQPYVDLDVYRAKYERPYLDDQLACLDGLDQLEHLYLQFGRLKPEGWERLGRQGRLKSLTIIGNPIDADGQVQMGRLTELESLSVEAKSGDADDLAFLDRLPKLRSLNIMSVPVTDAGLARIGRRTQLEGLSIDGSKLIGLEPLLKLHKLKGLTIRKCQISDMVIDQFKAARPDIGVFIYH
jgi:hypothetical protein